MSNSQPGVQLHCPSCHTTHMGASSHIGRKHRRCKKGTLAAGPAPKQEK